MQWEKIVFIYIFLLHFIKLVDQVALTDILLKKKKKKLELSTTYRQKMDNVLNWRPYAGKWKRGRSAEDGQMT